MIFGKLGSLGKLGASIGHVGGGGGAPAAPSLDFSDAANSQYQPLVISLFDDPYQSVDRDLMGINWKTKGRLP